MGSKLVTSETQMKEYLQEVQHAKGQLQQVTEKNSILKVILRLEIFCQLRCFGMLVHSQNPRHI